MSKPLCVSLSLVAAIGFSSLAFAATGAQTAAPPPPSSASMQHGHWHRRMHHRHGMGVLDKLDLSDTQRTNIRQMMRQSFEQSRPEMKALRQKREAFAASAPGSSGYQAAARELATAEANAARDRVMQRAALRSRIYAELTPGQRTELAKLRAQHKAQMQWRTEHMQHHRTAAPASASSTS